MAENEYLDSSKSRRWMSPKKLRSLTAYLVQVDIMIDLDAGTLPTIIARHLRQTNLLLLSESQEKYVELFRRYRSEWCGVLEQAQRNGSVLVNRIDVPGLAS